MPEVADTQAIETVSQPSFNRATKKQHDEFRHILLLLRLATAYNYGEPMLPNQDYGDKFDEVADMKYRQLTREGVLTALATIFVKDNEVIATTVLPLPGQTAVLTSVASIKIGIRRVMVVNNGVVADSDETCTDVHWQDSETVKPISLEQHTSIESIFEVTNNPEYSTQSHIATVCSFINDYKVQADPARRRLLFETFLQYLTATCYEKMYRRVCQWSFIGVLYHLYKVSDEDVRIAFHEHQVQDEPELSTNKSLVAALRLYLGPGAVQKLISHYPGKSPMSLSNLQAKLSADSEDISIYDETTCVEFHKLLIATLIGYAKSLYGARKAGEIKRVYGYSLILWELTKSQAFRLHITNLSSSELLPLPRYDMQNEYFGFAAHADISWAQSKEEAKAKAKAKVAMVIAMGVAKTKAKAKAMAMALGKGGGKGKEEETLPAPGVMNDNENEGEAAGETLAADVEDGEVDAEGADAEKVESEAIASQAMAESHGQHVMAKNLGTAYRRYIGIHVSYYGKAVILSQFSKHLADIDPTQDGPPFAAPTIANKQKHGQVCWSGVTSLLNDLASEQNTSDKEDIESRKTEYERIVRAVVNTASGVSPTFKQFRQLIDGSGGSPARLHNILSVVHCEAALATLLKFGQVLPAGMLTDRLREILQPLDSDADLIAVSRLCCPVCWELIRTLRGDKNTLELRGRHSMLFALELPQHLPYDILDTLIQRFRQYLSAEFQDMIHKWRNIHQKHHRTPSGQSDSAVSIIQDEFTLPILTEVSL